MFAAALLLSAFIARELWRRRGAPSSVAGTEVQRPVALNLTRPPLPSTSPGGRTETAVTGVAPIKLTRVQRRKPKPAPIPVPR